MKNLLNQDIFWNLLQNHVMSFRKLRVIDSLIWWRLFDKIKYTHDHIGFQLIHPNLSFSFLPLALSTYPNLLIRISRYVISSTRAWITDNQSATSAMMFPSKHSKFQLANWTTLYHVIWCPCSSISSQHFFPHHWNWDWHRILLI